jgi:transcriptional regulator GlxA family with amidase domain
VPPVGLKKQEMTRLIGEYLNRCYRTGSVPRASEFAASLQRDTKTVRRFIGRIYGVPLATLLRRKRLDKAAFLLRTTNHSVEEIIRRTASGDRGSFFRAFRAAFHASPLEYRLECRAGRPR